VIKYNRSTKNKCDRCGGFIIFDEDNDLKCVQCGRQIILKLARSKHVEQRRDKDTGKGTIRTGKKKTSGSNVDKSIITTLTSSTEGFMDGQTKY